MSVQLLDKTRKINKLLHNNNSTKVVFNDICKVMMECLDSNILVISKKGKVLGVSLCPGVEEITELIDDKVGGYVDELLNDRFLSVLSTKENVNLATLGFVGENTSKYTAIINPIEIAGERLGTVFMYRFSPTYDIDDIIVSEYGTTVVGLEMMRSVNEENVEENRKIQVVKSAFSTLSFSELEAIIHIFDELDGEEGILVASKIADRVGITRSVIVNALRKFESAGVIESRSSGMKGTYIKVLNDYIFDELKAIKSKKKVGERETGRTVERRKILPQGRRWLLRQYFVVQVRQRHHACIKCLCRKQEYGARDRQNKILKVRKNEYKKVYKRKKEIKLYITVFFPVAKMERIN